MYDHGIVDRTYDPAKCTPSLLRPLYYFLLPFFHTTQILLPVRAAVARMIIALKPWLRMMSQYYCNAINNNVQCDRYNALGSVGSCVFWRVRRRRWLHYFSEDATLLLKWKSEALPETGSETISSYSRWNHFRSPSLAVDHGDMPLFSCCSSTWTSFNSITSIMMTAS